MSQAAKAQTRPAFPEADTVFELTASAEITGLGLVEAFGYTPSKWRISAPTIPAGTTRRFKLVAVGYQRNLDAVARACKGKGGKPTNGCWMQVFNDTFGSNGVNPVGVPDASWVDPVGFAGFPVVGEVGYRRFRWAGSHRLADWLWLVEV